MASKDISISAAGSLGNNATLGTSFSIVANGQAAVIGGSAPGSGYTLDSAELGRITSRQIGIVAPVIGADAGRPADLFLRTMTLGGTETGPGLARFQVVTQGRVRVDGNVAYANAAATDLFSINAGERIQVITPAGAILLSDGLGAPAGQLRPHRAVRHRHRQSARRPPRRRSQFPGPERRPAQQ